MSRLGLLWVGKATKRDPAEQLCQTYIARMRAYGGLTEKVLKAKTATTSGTEEARLREGKTILDAIAPTAYVVLCDERGKQLSSKGLADFFTKRANFGEQEIVFVIGGAMGVSDAVRQRSNFVLSLTKMTLPHALARLLLTEQIYRAHCILAGHPYHHES